MAREQMERASSTITGHTCPVLTAKDGGLPGKSHGGISAKFNQVLVQACGKTLFGSTLFIPLDLVPSATGLRPNKGSCSNNYKPHVKRLIA